MLSDCGLQVPHGQEETLMDPLTVSSQKGTFGKGKDIVLRGAFVSSFHES